MILGYHPLSALSNFFSISFQRRNGLSVNRAPALHLGFPSKNKGGKRKEGEAGLFLDTPFDWAKIKKTVRFLFAEEKRTF
jgi:hypothetical protein